MSGNVCSPKEAIGKTGSSGTGVLGDIFTLQLLCDLALLLAPLLCRLRSAVSVPVPGLPASRDSKRQNEMRSEKGWHYVP